MVIHIYTQTIHRTTQITTNVEECGPCPVFASFTLAFALQLRKKHGKTSVRVLSQLQSVAVHIVYQRREEMILFSLQFLKEICFQFTDITAMTVSVLAAEITRIIEELPLMDRGLFSFGIEGLKLFI